MSEISEAAMAKADELLGEWLAAGISLDIRNRFARFIQQVNDAAKLTAETGDPGYVRPFILPEPVDPLEEAIGEAMNAELPANEGTRQGMARLVRERLAKRGLKIVETRNV